LEPDEKTKTRMRERSVCENNQSTYMVSLLIPYTHYILQENSRSNAANRRSAKMKIDHYTYRVTWSPEDGKHVGLCTEFPSLSWLASPPEAALLGIQKMVTKAVADMQANGEPIPKPLAEKHYSGEFRVRIPSEVHRALAMQAAEQGVSLNRLASAKLAG
jgi:predicted HicB family RNase H-like nuclease